MEYQVSIQLSSFMLVSPYDLLTGVFHQINTIFIFIGMNSKDQIEIFSEDETKQMGFADQYQILNAESVSKFPYNCIGYLTVLHQNNLYTGTGFLIAPDLVLTVAHNIYFRDKKKGSIDPAKISFYPGVSELKNIKKPHKVVNFRFPEEYKSCQKEYTCNYDYALLKLQQKVVRNQYINLGFDYSYKKETIGVFGYQTNMCNYDNTILQRGVWKSDSHEIQKNGLLYKISTDKGNSGSPILCRRGSDDSACAIGIHKGHTSSKEFNQGILINEKMINHLVRWQKDMHPSKIIINLEMTNNLQKLGLRKQDLPDIGIQQLLQKMKEKVKNDGFIAKFKWDIQQKYAKYFTIQGMKVSKNQDGYYQLVGAHCFPKASITSVKVKLHKYGGIHGICIGLITQNRKDKVWNDFDDGQSIGYWSSTHNQKGCIMIDGKQISTWANDLFLSVSSELLMQVDTINYNITFTNVAKKKEWTYPLKADHWKSRSLYLFVGIPSKGGVLQIVR